MDEEWARERNIPVRRLESPIPVFALDSSELPGIRHVTISVSLTISGNHQETISFSVFHSTVAPIVLGHPWLVQHNPQINWVEGTIQSWNLSSCSMSCVCCPCCFFCLCFTGGNW